MKDYRYLYGIQKTAAEQTKDKIRAYFRMQNTAGPVTAGVTGAISRTGGLAGMKAKTLSTSAAKPSSPAPQKSSATPIGGAVRNAARGAALVNKLGIVGAPSAEKLMNRIRSSKLKTPAPAPAHPATTGK